MQVENAGLWVHSYVGDPFHELHPLNLDAPPAPPGDDAAVIILIPISEKVRQNVAIVRDVFC